MTTTLAAFLSREPGREDQFEEYRHYMRLAQRAFLHTNPTGRYVVLTDKWSAISLAEFDVVVAIDDSLPLMMKTIEAGRRFLMEVADRDGGLTIIADADCVVQKDLSPILHFASVQNKDPIRSLVTYNDKSLRVNNVAYTREPTALAGVLSRAADILSDWPQHLKNWWGDQEAWDIALGDRDGEPGGVLYRSTRFPSVGLVPCSQYNCFMPKNGNTKSGTANALLVHFKGDRKQHMDQYVDKIVKGAT